MRTKYTAQYEFKPRGEDVLTETATLSATSNTRAEAKAKVLEMASKRFKKGYKILMSWTKEI